MPDAATIPTISFQNNLAYDLCVYDSFSPQPPTSPDQNYFGQLTLLGTIAAKSTGIIQPIRTSSAFLVDNNADKKPVKRCTKMAYQTTISSFTVAQADEDAMAATFKFIDFFLHQPDDPVSQAFKAILNEDAKKWLIDITAFFSKQPAYSLCTFQTYMMAITYAAQNPAPRDMPPDKRTYSLSTLVTLMGGKWPKGMTDISLSNLSCSTANDVLDIWADVDVINLPVETDQIHSNIKSMSFDKKVSVNFSFNYGFGLGMFGTRLSVFPENIKIPISGSTQLCINKPIITIDINPLFKFVVFTIRGIIPFNLFGKKFDANVSMVIDNVEAEVGVVIEGDSGSLPAPPLTKGVHFDQFGVGLGIFFQPPGYAIGIQGKLHIGEPGGPNIVDLNDDTFALVCKMNGDVPEPVYASFYVPKLDINKVIAIFTNATPNINIPVNFSDLSFRWAENPMEPYTLPDGTLSEMGYGFSAAVDVFSFGFFGDIEIDMNHGLTADVESSPVSLGPVFKLSGDGKGVTMKVDAAGNPIKNNQIRDKKVLQDALAHATDKQIVKPGGPVLIINTFKSPILHLNARATLFEIVDRAIEADINKDGIFFQLDFGGILTEKMTCKLSNFHNFYGSFTFGINRNFSLPTIAGVHLGSIHVEALAESHITIETSLSDVVLKIGGSFDFEGRTRRFGDFSADINITKISGVIEAIISNLTDFADQIFADVVQDAKLWANKAKQGLIIGYTAVSQVLKLAYNKSANEAASIMKGAGYEAHQIASEIKNTFNSTVHEMAAVMKFAGCSASEIAAEAKGLYNLADYDVAFVLKTAGYAANEVSNTVRNLFNLGVQDLESAMKKANYGAQEVISALKNTFNINDIAGALKNVYGLSVNDVNSFLQSAGYAADQVKQCFESLGGEFASFAKNTWGKITNPDTWNPSKW